MKNNIPEFLKNEFKKNPRSVRIFKYQQDIKDFMTDYSLFYKWSETDLNRIFKIMKQGVSKMPICEIEDCNNTVYVDYYGKVQKGCCKKHNTIITSREKYGVDHVTQTKKFQDNKKVTIKEKYGTDFVFQSENFKDKRNKTMLKKYGTDISMHIPESFKKMRCALQKTILKKYGVLHITQSEQFKEQAKLTLLQKYGVEYSMQSKIIKAKSKSKCLKKYGVENVSQSSVVKNKVRNKMEISGMWTSRDNLDDLEYYRRQVWIETRKQDIASLKYSESRGTKDYHLDHKFSIVEGFKNNILPSIIGNINNLEFIPYYENLSKGGKCSISLEEICKFSNK